MSPVATATATAAAAAGGIHSGPRIPSPLGMSSLLLCPGVEAVVPIPMILIILIIMNDQ